MKHVLDSDIGTNDDRTAMTAVQNKKIKRHIFTLTAEEVALQKQLCDWRNSFTIRMAKTEREKKQQFTMAVLCSGGCLDTIAGMRAGFRPIWSSEVSAAQARMFEDLTGGTCLGDTFSTEVWEAARVAYLKSGQPCPDYSRSGSKLGGLGETGWMFVHQVEVILHIQPWAVCLEISDNVVEVNGGKELAEVTVALEVAYVVYAKMIQVWKHGDPSNRTRLFLVALHKDLGQAAHEFKWPTESFDNSKVPFARLIAADDKDVPDKYWRHDQVFENEHCENEGMPHRIQVVARSGPGMGPAWRPHSVQNWQGLLNGPTALGGGGRHVELDWSPGEEIMRTRLTVPAEYVRAASQSDDYLEWCSKFADGDVDKFALLCINNGVPQRTSTAIDSQVMKILQKAELRKEKENVKHASAAHFEPVIRSMLVDTGANGTIHFRDCDSYLLDSRESECNIYVANKSRLEVGRDGKLPMQVLMTNGENSRPTKTRLDVETTTADVPMELFSLDPLYQTGEWGMHIRPANSDDKSASIYNIDGSKIPLRYDWGGQGGFWLDYMLIEDPKEEHTAWLKATFEDNSRALSAISFSKVEFYGTEDARAMANKIAEDKDVFEVIVGRHDADRQIRGVKSRLKSKVAKLTEADFHDLYGHLGYMPNCKICKMVKGAARRIYRKVDPHCETRAGFKWHLDTVTWNARSANGHVYMSVLRDEASGFFKILIHYLRDDVVDVLERFIETIREDPAFHDCPYKIFSELNLDNAGEWCLNCKIFKRTLEKQGVTPIYSCPDRKESAARAERACGIVEVVTKGLLMQNNLPTWWWEQCALSAEFLLNRFPMTSQAQNIPTDGDRVRPIELFFRFTYSRSQIDRELSYFIAPGTPALVQTTAKGSEVGPKTRWGIAKGMYREQVIFECPHTKAEFRSKSFAAFRLQDGLNYLQFLGLPEVETARSRVAIPILPRGTVVVKLPEHKEGLKNTPEVVVLGVDLTDEMAANPPSIQQTKEPISELGGQVKVLDASGKLLIGPELKPMDCAQVPATELEEAPECEITGVKKVPQGNVFVEIRNDVKIEALFDMADARKVTHKGVFTKGHETFARICKEMDLVFEQHQHYHEWLIKHCGFTAEVLPLENYAKLQPGLTLPFPSGSKWRQAIKYQDRQWRRENYAAALTNDRACQAANDWVENQLEIQEKQVREGGRYVFNIRASKRAMAARTSTNKAKKFKKKRTKAVATGHTPAPKNCRAAIESEQADQWVKAQGNEFYGLVELGVLDCGYTKQQLIDLEISNHDTPIPIGDYYELKFGSDGEIDKHKARMAIKGHKGNMQKGKHFDKTFAATPRENTSRFMCALVVLLNLFRGAFDITKAYCWADRPPNQLLALKYPDGFQEFDPTTGEELFIILRKNLYGDPAAGRLFGKARDKAIQEKFNQNGWKCTRCRMDPCLFVITKGGMRAWMLAHVDDCDIIAESQQLVDDIKEICKTIWTLTDADPEYMLGVRRKLTRDKEGNVIECNLDMIPYIEGMAEAFKEHLPKGVIKTPVTKGMFISKNTVVSEQESKEVLNAGFQVAVGMLMWAVRMCYPGGKVAVSMMCRVMAKPSWEVFGEAMNLIAWLYQNRTVGIKFSKCGNTIPIGLVDASNKPDPSDGKAQFGGVIMFMGATVIDISRKLKHSGLSSAHNEYMAMYYVHQALVWFRQLVAEMGLQELIKKPTIMLADNQAANLLSQEDIISHGNQYMYLPFHYNKEVQEQGFSFVEYVNTLQNISDLMTKAGGSRELNDLLGALTGHDTRLIEILAKKCADIQQGLPEQTLFQEFQNDHMWWLDPERDSVIQDLQRDTDV